MLSEQQRSDFLSQGYLMPGIEANVAAHLPEPHTMQNFLAQQGPWRDPAVDRHLDHPVTYALCTLPDIVERVAQLLGPDLLLWHSRYFSKPVGGPPVPWHQDAPFWNMQPMRCVSAWLALDDVHKGNGCVFAVPGSNHSPLPHIPSRNTGRFGRRADTTGCDLDAAVALEMPRGEFFLFDSWLLHRSDSNPGQESRLALSMQFITPDVQLGLEKLRARLPDYGVQVVRGADALHLNPVAPAPLG